MGWCKCSTDRKVGVQRGGSWWVFRAVVEFETFEHEYISLADADMKSLFATGSRKVVISGDSISLMVECVLEVGDGCLSAHK